MRRAREKSRLYMGIDLGSTSTEAVVVDENYRIICQQVIDTEPDHKACTDKILALVFQDLAGIYGEPITREDIQFCVGTGYGRENIHCASKTISEISCHARGARYYFPTVRTNIDIGGQDSKVISIDIDGDVIDFVMNEKCAAGTGRFLEAISGVCEVSLDELGSLSLQAEFETTISSMCTVFAESEVISRLAEGAEKDSIIKGLHSAIAFRVLSMGKRIGIKAPLVFSGGVARNTGMVRMLAEKTGFAKNEILVPPNPQVIGALGAACLALEEYHKQRNRHSQETAVNDSVSSREWAAGIIAQLEKEIPANPHSPHHKRKPLVGWTDLTVPVELLSAANINHIRITGDLDKGASSDRFIRTYSCAYIKNAISALFEKSEKYHDLDGIISTNCCSATEKMSDVLKCQTTIDNNKNNPLFVYPLTVPRKTHDIEAVDYMKENILALKAFIETTYHTAISEENVRNACQRYNRAKTLIREYSTLLARDNFPGAAGLTAFQVEQLWRQQDVTDAFLADLEHKIHLVKTMSPLEKQGPNILLAGSIIPEMKFYDIFRQIPCHLVYNHTSSGNKFAESLVDPEEPDIYRALARRSLYIGYTPRTMDAPSRMALIKNLVERFNAEGIIFNITKFCVYYTFEAVLLKEYCEEWNIPLLVIETDFTGKSLGQLKTRVEAFIETFK